MISELAAPLTVAKELLECVAKSGCSRQIVAATVAALYHLVLQDNSDPEIQKRMDVIEDDCVCRNLLALGTCSQWKWSQANMVYQHLRVSL
jgi:fructose-1,6-bisphosphatase